MSFAVDTLSLSALAPIKLTYSFNSAESLQSKLHSNSSNLRFRTHELLDDNEDIAISKHNMLSLTNIKDVKSIFENKPTTIGIDVISGSFQLTLQNSSFLEERERIIKTANDKFYMGGKGEVAVFHLLHLDTGGCNLKINNKYVQVEEEYPYALVSSEEPLLDENASRQRFFIEYRNKLMTIKTQTKEGMRYLSCGSDRVLRFVGVELNQTKINNYYMLPTFISSSSLYYGFDSTAKEIRYFNEVSETDNQKTVNIKRQIPTNTNLLVSCPSVQLAESSEVGVNISLLKTNFSTTGVFNTLL
jgi:hypothetical protein